ncbi:MAG: conjugal transfer protein TraS [Paucibacter sp.]|nr:conjugal transfer protein TraS [Roseateles sp.]
MGAEIDGVLVTWGERLFYPGNRMVKPGPQPRLDTLLRRKAAVIRRRVESTVVRRAPQVMVKIAGGGRGMRAIAAHFRYISKSGRLAVEDDRGVVAQGKEALGDLIEQWRWGGSKIEETSPRREAFNVMLSMPRGTESQIVLCAAREFAQTELSDHRYMMVLHEHQGNPHVHLCVRAESMSGKRLHPYRADLHRWRETFAERLRGWGVEAEATRQAVRGVSHRPEQLWQIRARGPSLLKQPGAPNQSGIANWKNRVEAMRAWANITLALRSSEEPKDRELAERIQGFVRDSTFMKELRRLQPSQQQIRDRPRAPPGEPIPSTHALEGRDRHAVRLPTRTRRGPDFTR